MFRRGIVKPRPQNHAQIISQRGAGVIQNHIGRNPALNRQGQQKFARIVRSPEKRPAPILQPFKRQCALVIVRDYPQDCGRHIFPATEQ